MPADLLISGGPIFTGTGQPAEAVAVTGGIINAVGRFHEVKGEAGPRTESIDLDGRALTPGFIDAHVHPLTGGLKLSRCSLHDATNAEEAIATVAAYARTHPDLPWIWGGGWSLSWFPGGTPDAASLDRATSERPALLYLADGHGAWVNTAALRLAGIDSDTPDPPDGRIERLGDGSPQGTLHEGAMALVERLVPEPSPAEWESALAEGQRYLLSCGITGWQDADVQASQHAAYLALAGRGELQAEVRGALWWERHRDAGQLENLLASRAEMAPRYRATAVKLMLDGIVENQTAALLGGYHDREGNPLGGSGIDFIPREDLIEIVSALDRFGFSCHFHAIGDRAVRHALDAIEAARGRNRRADTRHHIAHLQLVDPLDRARFESLAVTANAQPLWAVHEPQMDELTIPFLPPSARAAQYPFASLLQAGARLAMGSDWPVTTADVMHQVEVAVTRVSPQSRSTPPYAASERVAVGEALRAFTRGSAWVNQSEERAGSIEPGKRADLVILEADPLTESPIGDIKVEATLIGGSVAYQRSRGG
jgi:predicted amidohydrolase YtcJ